MAYLVELTEPRSVDIREYPRPEPGAGEVLVRTLYSGISAGTELATYRGTNPYLREAVGPGDGSVPARPDHLLLPARRLGLLRGRRRSKRSARETSGVAVGDVVWGIWGHRSHAVLPAERLAGHQLDRRASTRSSAPSTGSGPSR